ncbi:MAG: M48 family metalloprotease [Pseudomonadales bacterium]
MGLKTTLLYAAAIVCSGQLAQANNLPTLGNSSSSVITFDTEHSLGQGIIRQIRGSNTLLDDPIVEGYLTDLVWDLVPSSQLQDRRLSLAFIENNSINAFAAPGGVLGLNTGLILAAKREDEVASVISHELAHLSQRHFANLLARNKANAPLTIATLLGGLLASAANPQAGSAVLIGGIAKQQSSALAFSRRNEQEADRIGMQNLVRAGYDPNAMPRMFERLLERQRLQGSAPPEFLLTHPTSISRIADAKNRAVKLGYGRKAKDTLEFKIVKARLDASQHTNPLTALATFKARFNSDPSAINRYSLAMAQLAASRPTGAVKLIQGLPANWRKHLYIRLSLAQAHERAGNDQSAHQLLVKLQKNYPSNLAVERSLAKFLFEQQRYTDAIEVLQDILSYAEEDTAAWYYLAEAYGKLGERHLTHRARINYFLLRGQVASARRQLTFARRERSVQSDDLYQLDQLELELTRVERYLNTRY